MHEKQGFICVVEAACGVHARVKGMVLSKGGGLLISVESFRRNWYNLLPRRKMRSSRLFGYEFLPMDSCRIFSRLDHMNSYKA